ncbi:hypothetical protein GGR57DRAFT_452739 [Xylariaceae sp. FL1272]|nr:hypothetical protein GGR57DRAFT_452739 [Xylariaceae sp. FL1272]
MHAVMKDLDASNTYPQTQEIAVSLLGKILSLWRNCSDKYAEVPALATWAWKRGYRGLYGAAVKNVFASITWEHEGEGISRAIGRIANADDSRLEDNAALSWDDYLDDATVRIGQAHVMSASFTQIDDTLVENLKPSFKTWRKATEVKLLNDREVWDLSTETDFEYFVAGVILSKLDDPYWIDSYFVPELKARGARPLIIFVLNNLLTCTEEDERAKARDVASKVINATYWEIVRDLVEFDSFGWRREKYPRACKKFSWVLEQCMLLGLQDETVLLLDALWAAIKWPYDRSDEDPNPLTNEVRWYDIPRAFQLLHSILKFLLHNHISYLDSTKEMFTSFLREHKRRKPTPEVLNMNLSGRKRMAFQRRLDKLQRPYLRGLLGDDIYREVFMLEHVNGTEGTTQGASTGATAETMARLVGTHMTPATAEQSAEVAGGSQVNEEKAEAPEDDATEKAWVAFLRPGGVSRNDEEKKEVPEDDSEEEEWVTHLRQFN